MGIGAHEDEGGEEGNRQGTPKRKPMLKLGNILPGQAVKVREVRETYLYREESKVLRGETHREYDVVYLRKVPAESVPPAPECRIRRIIQCSDTGEERLRSAYSEEGLEQAIAGNVTKVTETLSRVLYQNEHKVMEDKTTRVYDVNFLAGISDK